MLYLKKNHVILWYASIGMFIISLVPFFRFMDDLTLKNLVIALAFISAAAVTYVISTKLITTPDGYTATQAMTFYKACKKEHISKPEQFRKKTVKVKEIASAYEFSKDLELDVLFGMFEIGYGLLNGKEKN